MSPALKTALGIALIVALLAVAYYFGVALPTQNRAKLQLCLVAAEGRFNRGLELNGTPVPGKKDSYNLPSDMLKNLHKQQNDENEACRKEYELTLKAIEAK